MPGGQFSRPGDDSGPISGHFRRFRARPTICDLNIVTLPQFHKIEISETSTLCVETRKMSVLATEEMSAVETRQMSSVARADICLVSTHNVQVSEVPIVAMSQCASLR